MADAAPIILVTGATGHLGRAVLADLDARGCRIAAMDRTGAPLEAVLADLPGAARHLPLAGHDLTDAASCGEAVAAAERHFGRVDGLAHTVGGFAMTSVTEAGPAEWEAMFRLNLLGTANIFRAAIGAMRARRAGSLVAVGALAAISAPAMQAPYAASKAGVLRLVESAAAELRGDGIRVNAVLPTTLDTPVNRAAMPGADHSAWVQPAAVARVIGFLLSSDASGITGALLPVTAPG
ncbi:SDR family NAD(P)-dependent oxidoreductase [Roseomonas sp. CCTCC AB2023176]|uniref:SDR family NAD(P)-dependent oxidoreductase n=1 Tax=Roseomonas sp. CCTCC AB2023176 TaxID=3342640 RepID=UPI0035D69FF3